MKQPRHCRLLGIRKWMRCVSRVVAGRCLTNNFGSEMGMAILLTNLCFYVANCASITPTRVLIHHTTHVHTFSLLLSLLLPPLSLSAGHSNAELRELLSEMEDEVRFALRLHHTLQHAAPRSVLFHLCRQRTCCFACSPPASFPRHATTTTSKLTRTLVHRHTHARPPPNS